MLHIETTQKFPLETLFHYAKIQNQDKIVYGFVVYIITAAEAASFKIQFQLEKVK